MRLFMSYLATHPEKLDPVKKQQWAKLARLDAQDMDTVCNMAYLNVAVMKQPGSQVRPVTGPLCALGVGYGCIGKCGMWLCPVLMRCQVFWKPLGLSEVSASAGSCSFVGRGYTILRIRMRSL